MSIEQRQHPEIKIKAEVDRLLFDEALRLDKNIYSAPIRPMIGYCVPDNSLFDPVLISPSPRLEPLKLLPPAISHNKRNKTAFMPIPDGSHATFAAISELANQKSLSFNEATDYLHALGINGHLGEILSIRNVVRLARNGVKISSIAGGHRSITAGFDYGIFNCSHPNVIDEEMQRLGTRVDSITNTIRQLDDQATDIDINSLRVKLSETRFCSSEKVQQFTDKELVAYLTASEVQRIIAYIHPWFERVGRTSEECMGLIALKCGVTPLFLSTPNNRSTTEGYERGVVNGMTAIGFLRELGKKFDFTDEQVSKIYNMKDFYGCLPDRTARKTVLNSPLNTFVYSRNIFPDVEIMRKYYEQTHQIILGLIGSFEIATLIQDLATIYLAGHLIGRGKSVLNFSDQME